MTTVEIKRLGHLGDGIAEGPVYVPGALPGEVVSGTLEGDQLREPKIETGTDMLLTRCSMATVMMKDR